MQNRLRNIGVIMHTRFAIAKEVVFFLSKRKLWWLIPMFIVLLIVGLILIVVEATAIFAPFIYTLV